MNNIITHYKANARIWQAGGAFIVCILIHNFPSLISFFPDGAKNALQTAVYAVINGGVGYLAIFLAKQFNTSGNGTVAEPFTKPTGDGGTKTIQP